MGAQPKSTYTALREEPGIEVVWYDSVLTGAARVLSIFMASYAGLIKISELKKLPSVVKKLSLMSMVGVYVFNQSMEREFIDCVMKNPLPKEFDFGIKNDRGYFLYIVDADNVESSTGIYEIVSYGKDAADFSRVL